MPPRRDTPDQYEFELWHSADYLHIVHTECNADADIRYLGLDGIIPKIEVMCQQCKERREWKLYAAMGKGFPPLPSQNA